ncbi:MAG: hypothetical protein PHW73_01260 [Atribacterota bacterium]|nr:hypothetical protein [Atribacterota bacterium]
MKNKKKPPISVMATHLPLITRAFDKSSGPVLEMGTGYFSTLYLDWLCNTFHRKLISYESGEVWYERAKKYNSDYHKVILVENWDKADIESIHWGLVFIDHKPPKRRPIDAIRLKDNADYIVMHDTEPESDYYYGYHIVWEHFKYRYDYKKIKPWTSVVSNFKKLDILI